MEIIRRLKAETDGLSSFHSKASSLNEKEV